MLDLSVPPKLAELWPSKVTSMDTMRQLPLPPPKHHSISLPYHHAGIVSTFHSTVQCGRRCLLVAWLISPEYGTEYQQYRRRRRGLLQAHSTPNFYCHNRSSVYMPSYWSWTIRPLSYRFRAHHRRLERALPLPPCHWCNNQMSNRRHIVITADATIKSSSYHRRLRNRWCNIQIVSMYRRIVVTVDATIKSLSYCTNLCREHHANS